MKLNVKRTCLIGLSFASILAFWQFYDQVIPYLLENVFGKDTMTTNAIMSIDNVLAIFMLPLFGALSDRTHTRLGKRTPYILFGTLAAVALLVALSFSVKAGTFIGFFLCLLALLVVMSMYRTPAVAYMPDVTEKPLRSKGNAIINLIGYVGGIFATIMMMLLLKSHKQADGSSVYDAGQNFMPIFLVIAGFMLVTVLIMVLSVKENSLPHVQEEKEQNAGQGRRLEKGERRSLILILLSVFLWFMAYNGVTTSFSRYCVDVWGADLSVSSGYLMVATIAAIAAFLPLGLLSGKLGRKKTILCGVAAMTACYAIAILLNKPSALMYVLFGVVGVGWAAINVNSFPMVVELCSGGDVGKYTGYYYTFSMAAQIVTPLLSALFIQNTSLHYRVLFPYAVVFSSLAFITMLFVKHGDSKPEAKKGLESFDVSD